MTARKRIWKRLAEILIMVAIGVMICRISPEDVEQVANQACNSINNFAVGAEQRYIYYIVWDSTTRQAWGNAQSEIFEAANDTFKNLVNDVVETVQNPAFDGKYQKFKEVDGNDASFIEMQEFSNAKNRFKDFNEEILEIFSNHGFDFGKDQYTDFMIVEVLKIFD